MALRSEESWQTTLVINGAKEGSIVMLGPGEYEVSVVYYAKTKRLLREATEDLTTNVLKLTIEE